VNDNISIYEMVDNIVQVVIATHFSYVTDRELRKDLSQTGFLKAYELLNNGNYDPNLSLRNFLYTGVRNEIHNTLYHLGKIPTVSLDGLDVYDNVIGYRQVRDFTVQGKVVWDVVSKFSLYGDYFPQVANYLNKLGIFDGVKYEETEVDDTLTDGIITLTLWKLYECEVANG
jgi:hypothetical protein